MEKRKKEKKGKTEKNILTVWHDTVLDSAPYPSILFWFEPPPPLTKKQSCKLINEIKKIK